MERWREVYRGCVFSLVHSLRAVLALGAAGAGRLSFRLAPEHPVSHRGHYAGWRVWPAQRNFAVAGALVARAARDLVHPAWRLCLSLVNSAELHGNPRIVSLFEPFSGVSGESRAVEILVEIEAWLLYKDRALLPRALPAAG